MCSPKPPVIAAYMKKNIPSMEYASDDLSALLMICLLILSALVIICMSLLIEIDNRNVPTIPAQLNASPDSTRNNHEIFI